MSSPIPSETLDPFALAGQVIDKYEIVELAGSGGFSVVYRAKHTLWDEPVAIKLFHGLLTAPDNLREKLLAGFIREGKLMSRLSTRSAAVVQARDVGRYHVGTEWVPYMVLEWVDGEPLDAMLDFEADNEIVPRTLVEILDLLRPAAEALAIAHDLDIAHRDLKPGNLILLPEQGMVKVLDFGIAKVMEDGERDARRNTGVGLGPFTPAYGAPEQFSRTHGATGPWTDVFAMALILVEMMRNEPVLDGTMLQNARLSCDPTERPTPRTLGLEVSDAVEAVFTRALSVSVDDRYANMRQFWAELAAAAFEGRSSETPMSLAPLPSSLLPRDSVTIEIASEPEPPTPEAVVISDTVLDEPTLVSRGLPEAAADAPDASPRTGWRTWLAAGLVVASVGIGVLATTSADPSADADQAAAAQERDEPTTTVPDDDPPPTTATPSETSDEAPQPPEAESPPEQDEDPSPPVTAAPPPSVVPPPVAAKPDPAAAPPPAAEPAPTTDAAEPAPPPEPAASPPPPSPPSKPAPKPEHDPFDPSAFGPRD